MNNTDNPWRSSHPFAFGLRLRSFLLLASRSSFPSFVLPLPLSVPHDRKAPLPCTLLIMRLRTSNHTISFGLAPATKIAALISGSREPAKLMKDSSHLPKMIIEHPVYVLGIIDSTSHLSYNDSIIMLALHPIKSLFGRWRHDICWCKPPSCSNRHALLGSIPLILNDADRHLTRDIGSENPDCHPTPADTANPFQ